MYIYIYIYIHTTDFDYMWFIQLKPFRATLLHCRYLFTQCYCYFCTIYLFDV